ncbi:HNH endonuclease [Aeromicrobium sp.]|uniref:HNH endonuclease n=1 Tax=Aeromicrobium sp. TaxID=1871063 RepID=UPI002FCA3E12
MFTEIATEDVLGVVRAHDFGDEPQHHFGAARIDAIVALERLNRATQAEMVAQIAALHDDRAEDMGIGRGDPTLSVIGEVALARNIGPSAAGTQVGLALGLRRLPRVAELFADGSIPQPVAQAVVNESVCLAVDDSVVFDGEISPQLPGLTAKKAAKAARREVVRIDVEAARERAERNRADQRVTMFPDTDGVAILQVRGPAEQMLAAHNALDSWARGLRSAGDERTVGQIMAQTLVERVTGVAHADAIDVEIQLVMDAPTMLGQDGEPVDLVGYGPISPDIADDLIAHAPNPSIRRLLTDPVDGTLLVREPRRRRFDSLTRSHIRARDRMCRMPGCDARIRDDDHIHDHSRGGVTTHQNGQGLCKRSHTIKSLPGWKVTTEGRTTIWQTPTGHTYRSDPPPLLPRNQPGHLRQ